MVLDDDMDGTGEAPEQGDCELVAGMTVADVSARAGAADWDMLK